MADKKNHWETVYETKPVDSVSWYTPRLSKSIDIIMKSSHGAKDRAIIDVGSGASNLVDDLLLAGFTDITMLDISERAIAETKQRLRDKAALVSWIIDDITKVSLPAQRFDIWHDRAVFHFLTSPEDRVAYVSRVAASVRPGGHVIVATFGPEGPEKCSGLEVVRYDSESLHDQFGSKFRLVEHSAELHKTPFGTTQHFVYCLCRVEG